MSTAFVLAGGGSLGAVQVGMLKALAAAGVVPDFVVGASVGALNAICYAAQPDLRGVAHLERIWRGLHGRGVFRFSALGALGRLLGRRDYLISPKPLRTLIATELPCALIEHTQLPCHLVTTDLMTGAELVLSSGPAAPALLASTAIPVVFPPVVISGRAMIDGGVASNTPISAACDRGASRVIVLPTGSPCTLPGRPHGVLAIALHALNLLSMRQLLADFDRSSARCELVVVPPLCPMPVHAYDFSQSGALIDRAEAATRDWLEDGLAAAGRRGFLVPHQHTAPAQTS